MFVATRHSTSLVIEKGHGKKVLLSRETYPWWKIYTIVSVKASHGREKDALQIEFFDVSLHFYYHFQPGCFQSFNAACDNKYVFARISSPSRRRGIFNVIPLWYRDYNFIMILISPFFFLSFFFFEWIFPVLLIPLCTRLMKRENVKNKSKESRLTGVGISFMT